MHQISDTPVVFHTADGKPYIPLNFKGEWEGDVSLWRALTRSMNVPSLKILDGIGFEAAIDRAVALLGIPKNEIASRAFVPGYPIGLGVCSVRPVEMARAYAIFANGGKEITPMAIRTVEDKNGNVNLKAFNISESSGFGVFRAIVDNPDEAYDRLMSRNSARPSSSNCPAVTNM